VLYSKPYRAGLRFKQVKELAAALKMSERQPFDRQRLWLAFRVGRAGEGEGPRRQGAGGRDSRCRHAIDPDADLVPVGLTVRERYGQWLTERAAAGVTFTRTSANGWTDRGPHRDESAGRAGRLQDEPFYRFGGYGKAVELFGDQLATILEDLNTTLAA